MTGYTSALCDKNMDFPQFALYCARAMGACITMRDDPADATIPEEFKPSEYDREQLEKWNARLKFLNEMPPDQQEEWAKTALADAIAKEEAFEAKYCAEKQAVIEKCKAMLMEVRAWKPPTEEHDNFKNFMIQQLTDTIQFEGNYEKYAHDTSNHLRSLTPKQFYQEELDEAVEKCEYYRKQWDGEVERAKSRTNWVRKLRESLSKG